MSEQHAVFFGEYPISYAFWGGVVRAAREAGCTARTVLVTVPEANSRDYDHSAVEREFDTVIRLPQWVWYGRIAGAWSLPGLASHARNLVRAARVWREIKGLPLPEDGAAFVHSATLASGMFLRAAGKAGLRTVLLAERTRGIPDDALIHASEVSRVLNVYQRVFGTAPIDIYALRVPEGLRTSQRETRFRKRPADLVVAGEHAHRRSSLESGETYWPVFPSLRREHAGKKTVVLIGGVYVWEPLVFADAFYREYNVMIDLIRKRYPTARLVYMSHPGNAQERAAEIRRLDLSGFEISGPISPEAFVRGDPSVSVAFAAFSTCVMTLAACGVRTHSLHRLFSEEAIHPALKDRLDDRWSNPNCPQRTPSSATDLFSGKCDYTPEDRGRDIFASTVQLLELSGLLPRGRSETFQKSRSELFSGDTPTEQ